MNVDRNIAKKALTDGFCLLYGEKYKTLLDTVGEEIIELGIKNGEKYFNEFALYNTEKAMTWIALKYFNPSAIFKTVDEFKDTLRKELKPFLSAENIEKLFVEQPYISFQDSKFAPPVNVKGLFAKISNELENIKPTPAKKITSFDYFKQFPIYEDHKSVNLATEGGLGLDQFNYKSVKYYLEEGEDCYLAEAIPYKYHQLGSVLIRETLRLKMIDEIKKHITPSSDYSAKKVLRNMLDVFCFPSERDDSLFDIQKIIGETGFSTPKQVHKRLKKKIKIKSKNRIT